MIGQTWNDNARDAAEAGLVVFSLVPIVGLGPIFRVAVVRHS